MISLRGPALKLMALRGRFSLGQGPLTELELAVGQQIRLADGLSLHVAAVQVPEAALALEGADLPRQVLAGVASLELTPRPRLRRGSHAEAVAVIWSDGAQWRLRMGGSEREVRAGDTFTAGGEAFSLVAVPLGTVGGATRKAGAVTAPLRIEARHDTVHISRDGEVVLRLVGAQARIVSELVLIAGPAPWHVVAGEVWPEVADPRSCRHRWDISLSRLRRRLREVRVRADLIKADGKGNYELFLHPNDALVDNT